MVKFRAFPAILAVLTVLVLPERANAQVPGVGSMSELSSLLPILGIGTAPPQMPSYQPPAAPGPGYQYTPGYWGYGQGGYSWVPGTYEQPPQPGAQWTPGYWGYQNGGYNWSPGYWGNQVGYYGGVNYGGGYTGTGYNPGAFSAPPTNFTSYNGGPGGIVMSPNSQQLAIAHEQHYALTPAQQEHIRESESDRNNLASVNKGKPRYTSVEHPYSEKNRPKDYAPITKSDRDLAAKNFKHQDNKNDNGKNSSKKNDNGKNGNGKNSNKKNDNGKQNGSKKNGNGKNGGKKNGNGKNGGKKNDNGMQNDNQKNGKHKNGKGKSETKPDAHASSKP